MKYLSGPVLALSLAACALLPLATHAQSPAQLPVPQDPQAAVPATEYRSAFDGYRSAAEDDATPDETWRAVNQKVGQAGGHQGHMMHMGAHAMPMAKPAAAATPAPAEAAEHHQHQGH